MLVLSREAGSSIHVRSSDETCVVTVLKLLPKRSLVEVLVNRASAAHPGDLECRSIELALGTAVKISDTAEVTLIDLQMDKARIGITAPKHIQIMRHELYEGIRFEKRSDSDPEDGMAGSRVPRPPASKPPSLNIRLEEPPAGDGAS